MKNLALWIVLLVFLAGGLLWWKNLSPDKTMKETAMENTPYENGDVKDGDSMMIEDRYVEYSSGELEKNKDKRRVLFFYANWCPVCRPADISFRENESRIPEDTVLVRVNFNDSDTDNEENALAKKYAVSYQHTYVLLDGQDNEIKRWNYGEIQELLENLSM